MEIVIIIVAAVIAIGVLVGAVIAIRRDRQVEIDERLGRYASEYSSQYSSDLMFTDASETEDSSSALQAALDNAIEEREFAQKWKIQLARADLKITPGEFLMAHFVSVAVFFVVVYFVISGNNIVLGILGGVAGFFAPRIYLARRVGNRLNSFEGQLPDILQMWVNGLRSGYSVLQAIEAISKEAPEPVASEFKRVVQEVQLGIPMQDALEHLLERMPSDDLDLVITAVNIQREVGGNLAEILDIIGHTIRERIKLKGEIRVLTAQGRVTGYIIAGMPILLMAFLMLVNPDYMGQMFENQLCGWPMLGCGAGMIALGAAAINKIVTIEI